MTATRTARRQRLSSTILILLRAVGGAQAVVFSDSDAHDLRRLGQLGVHALEDVAGKIFARRYQLPIAEVRDVEIDVAVVETIPHVGLQNAIEHAEIHDKSRLIVEWPADSHIAYVAVPMKVGPRARAESAAVFFVAPLGAAISVGRRERDSAGQGSSCHA